MDGLLEILRQHFLMPFERNYDIMAKSQEDIKMDMDELGFFLFMEEQERKEKEKQQAN